MTRIREEEESSWQKNCSFHLSVSICYWHKKLSCRREAERCFVSLNISL